MSDTFNKIHLIRQIDLFTLKLFLTVVEEGQVGRAAARENIAASAATKRIQDLEEVVGANLFERNPRGVLPTAAGLVLMRHLTQVFSTLEHVGRELGEFTQGVRGTIRVASTGGIIFQYLSREVAEFARSFPMVDIDLREGTNPEVIQTVNAGEVDVAVFVGAQGVGKEEYDELEYRTDRLVAVVPVGHPLARQQHVKLIDLLALNFIAIQPTTSLMAQVRQTAMQAGITFKPKYTVNSIYAATSLVRVNQGVTIQPDHMLTTQDLEFVQTVPLDETWALRRLVVATPRGCTPSIAAQNFVDQLTTRPG
jgi:DNA-binding transcriptional LysR family regulator